MSIFKKISLLFLVSLSLMAYLTYLTNKSVENKIANLYKQKYIQVSKEFFRYLSDADFLKLKLRAKELNFEKVDTKIDSSDAKVVFEDKVSFGGVKIFKKDGFYYLYMNYLDDDFLFFDKSQTQDLQDKKLMNYLFSADILLIFVIFAFLVFLLRPLKSISLAMERFGKGEHKCRLKELDKNDEISKVIKEFNKMARNIENLLSAREQLLRDVSHELRTPIARMKLISDMMQKNPHSKKLKDAIEQIDTLTNELLNVEKLNSHNLQLNLKEYDIETILAHTFSKMFIDDDSLLEVEIKQKVDLRVDLEYFSMALKNLIDNALKYKSDGVVKVVINGNSIEITNRAKPLKRELEFYTNPFTQEDSSRQNSGYGIGLNLVKRVLDKHHFSLDYLHVNGVNIFKITIESL